MLNKWLYFYLNKQKEVINELVKQYHENSYKALSTGVMYKSLGHIALEVINNLK